MDLLASGAMTVLGIQWFLAAQLILNLAAVTAPLVADLETFGLVMDSVWRTMLPLIQLAFSRSWIAVLAISGVSRVGHVALPGVVKDLIEACDGFGCGTWCQVEVWSC